MNISPASPTAAPVEKTRPESLSQHRLRLDEIGDNIVPGELDESTVTELVTSISQIGLLHSLTVDSLHKLVAGRHRREALRRISAEIPEVFTRHFPDGTIPVVILPFPMGTLVDSLRYVAGENGARRQYTAEYAAELRESMRAAGSLRVGRGRPKPGEERLNTLVAKVLGCTEAALKKRLTKRPPRNKLGNVSPISPADADQSPAVATSPVPALVTAIGDSVSDDDEQSDDIDTPEVDTGHAVVQNRIESSSTPTAPAKVPAINPGKAKSAPKAQTKQTQQQQITMGKMGDLSYAQAAVMKLSPADRIAFDAWYTTEQETLLAPMATPTHARP